MIIFAEIQYLPTYARFNTLFTVKVGIYNTIIRLANGDKLYVKHENGKKQRICTKWAVTMLTRDTAEMNRGK